MENTSVKKKEKSGQQPLKHICMGILAHVDAGKTTLAESILYLTGSIKKPGRVDHQDAFLDTDSEFVISAVADKITGKSPFKGKSPVDPFCGREDTRF